MFDCYHLDYRTFFFLGFLFGLTSYTCIIYPSGTIDLENGADENFLHSAETDNLKGASTPISTAAIMPSPIFLWRIKVLLFFNMLGLLPVT